ncbi:MAG: hypothetical protein JSV88_04365 [Candidatus Aminicenantes bacterium]|nr:MAG: hypothetical protein JSV88_04365 [Candidatus Aminicenantes bacterium]
MMEPILKTFQHSGNLGDIIYSLPTIIALGGGVLYIRIGTGSPELSSKAPAPNPMTEPMALQVIELLKTQPYLTAIRLYNNERVDYNLDMFREHQAVMTNHIAKSHLDAFGVNYNLALAWLQDISPLYINDIVISRTKRNLSTLNKFNWHVLSKYEEKCIFIGFEDEYEEFKACTGLNIERYPAGSILEIARVIKGSKLFMGNQSLGFALAEAMKHPRVLEVYYVAPNCIPQSLNGHIKLSKKMVRNILNKKQKRFLPPRFDHLLASLRNFLFIFLIKLRKKLFYLR